MRVKEITVEELAQRLEAQAPTLLVDVRQPWEYEIAHLPGSVLAPLGELTEHVDDLLEEEDALVVVLCHHGVRSLSGAAILNRCGIDSAVSLAGGIDAWSRRIDPAVPLY